MMEKTGKGTLVFVLTNGGFDFIGKLAEVTEGHVAIEHPLTLSYDPESHEYDVTFSHMPRGAVNPLDQRSHVMVVPMRVVAYYVLLDQEADHEICRKYESFFNPEIGSLLTETPSWDEENFFNPEIESLPTEAPSREEEVQFSASPAPAPQETE